MLSLYTSQPLLIIIILLPPVLLLLFLRDRMEEEGLALPDDYPRSFDDMPKGLTTEELMEEEEDMNSNIDNDEDKMIK